MKSATLKIADRQGRVGEIEVTDIPDGTSEIALKTNYNKFMFMFMKNMPGVHVTDVIWLPSN